VKVNSLKFPAGEHGPRLIHMYYAQKLASMKSVPILCLSNSRFPATMLHHW